MSKILLAIDKLGKDFKFNIKGDNFRTYIGGLISISYYIGAVVLAYYFGKDVYYKENPNFLQMNDIADSYPSFNFTSQNFFFAFGIKNQKGHVHNFSYFDAGFIQFNGQQVVKKLYPVKCNQIYDEKFINKHKISQFYCFDIDYKIQGYWDSYPIHYAFYLLKRCNNETEKRLNIKCATNEEFRDTFKNTYLAYIIQNNKINPSNFSKPYKEVMNYGNEVVNIDKIYNKDLFFSLANVTDDVGLVFEENTVQTYFELDNIRTFGGKAETLGDYHTLFRIFVSKNYNLYSRSYLRLPDVIANVGGFLDLVMIFIEYLYSFYLDNNYMAFLYKKLFKLEIDTEIEENGEKNKDINDLKRGNDCTNKISTDLKMSKNETNELTIIKEEFKDQQSCDKMMEKNRTPKLLRSILFNQKKTIMNKDFKKLLNHKSKARKEITVKSCERCLFLNGCKKGDERERSMKNELILAAEKTIEHKSEIFELWKELDQLRLFKKIFFNESQCYMLKKRGLQILVNKESKDDLSNEELKDLEEIKNQKNKKDLIDYFKKNKEKKQYK